MRHYRDKDGEPQNTKQDIQWEKRIPDRGPRKVIITDNSTNNSTEEKLPKNSIIVCGVQNLNQKNDEVHHTHTTSANHLHALPDLQGVREAWGDLRYVESDRVNKFYLPGLSRCIHPRRKLLENYHYSPH
jgi:hypothetical protein